MKRVFSIHTVKSVMTLFEDLIHQQLPEVELYSLYDNFFALDTNREGKLTDENFHRLVHVVEMGELMKADAIVCSCSSLTPGLERIRETASLPIVTVDDALGKLAAQKGKVTVLATSTSALNATMLKIAREAQSAGLELGLTPLFCPEGFEAIQKHDRAAYDAAVLTCVKAAKAGQVIVLAQASMAHLQQQIAQATGCEVLASPPLCVAQLAQTLGL